MMAKTHKKITRDEPLLLPDEAVEDVSSAVEDVMGRDADVEPAAVGVSAPPMREMPVVAPSVRPIFGMYPTATQR